MVHFLTEIQDNLQPTPYGWKLVLPSLLRYLRIRIDLQNLRIWISNIDRKIHWQMHWLSENSGWCFDVTVVWGVGRYMSQNLSTVGVVYPVLSQEARPVFYPPNICLWMSAFYYKLLRNRRWHFTKYSNNAWQWSKVAWRSGVDQRATIGNPADGELRHNTKSLSHS